MNLTDACAALELRRSGYYAWRHKSNGPRRTEDAVLAAELRTAFHASRGTYGSPRLCAVLRRKGLHHGKNRITRLMREQGLAVRQKRRYVPRTTVADKAAAPAPNHLLTKPAPQRLNEIWLTDITYIPTAEGWLYLAAEMDLCSRRILGWSTGASLATELPLEALEKALDERSESLPQERPIHHSDRGCQYSSGLFRGRLELSGIPQSMSRSGNCYDNAAMESFWATLKTEGLAGPLPATRAAARAMIFDYIETFYNPVRLHSALGYQSPVEFENSLQSI